MADEHRVNLVRADAEPDQLARRPLARVKQVGSLRRFHKDCGGISIDVRHAGGRAEEGEFHNFFLISTSACGGDPGVERLVPVYVLQFSIYAHRLQPHAMHNINFDFMVLPPCSLRGLWLFNLP